MRIRARRRFKEDYKRLEAKLKKPAAFKKNLSKVISLLQKDTDLPPKYIVNRLTAQGEGWYACYFYEDFVMIYKIQGQYIKLSRIGTAKELGKAC